MLLKDKEIVVCQNDEDMYLSQDFFGFDLDLQCMYSHWQGFSQLTISYPAVRWILYDLYYVIFSVK